MNVALEVQPSLFVGLSLSLDCDKSVVTLSLDTELIPSDERSGDLVEFLRISYLLFIITPGQDQFAEQWNDEMVSQGA